MFLTHSAAIRVRSHELSGRFCIMNTGGRPGLTELDVGIALYAAIVTSTSTPASMLIMICFTTSVGALRSIKRLWILFTVSLQLPRECVELGTYLISNISQVLLPSPHGVLRVEILRFLVGRRTGPLTRKSFVLARSMSSLHTFSSDETLRDVSVMRILWIFGWSSCDVFFGSWNDILAVVVSCSEVRRLIDPDHDCGSWLAGVNLCGHDILLTSVYDTAK